MVGVLGDYLAMVNVPADTSGFPNEGSSRWGQVILLNKPQSTRVSVWRMLEEMMKVSESKSSPLLNHE
jgi:hypothetical protein